MAELSAQTVVRSVRCDLKRLPVDSTDAFILSHLDGRSTLEELASVCGMAMVSIRRVVARLCDLGAAEVVVDERRRASTVSLGAPRSSRSSRPAMPAVLPASLVPRLIHRRGAASKAADGREAFVLAQVDGATAVDDISAVTGFSIPEVSTILGRLSDAGVVALDSKDPGERPPRQPAWHARTSVPTPRHVPEKEPSSPRAAPKSTAGRSVAPKSIAPKSIAPRKQTSRGISLRSSAPKSAPPGRLTPKSVAPKAPAPRTVPPASVAPKSHTPKHLTSKSASPARRASRQSMRAPRSVGGGRGPASRKLAAAAGESDVCELDEELKGRVDAMVVRLATATLYDLLGVGRGATKKEIKRGYFEHAAWLHPDRHFRKKLGPYKSKMHDVFVRITSAHETLTDAVARAAYDRTLPSEDAVAPAPIRRPPSQPAPAAGVAATPPLIGELQRQAFAARISGVKSAAPAASTPPRSIRSDAAPRVSAPPSNPADDPLRRFFADKAERAGRERARVFVAAADYALAKANFASALQNYELALQCCDAPEIRAARDDVAERARSQTHERAMREAAIAERAERWDEAVRRYGKAYDTLPSASIAERLANALRREGSDLRRAVKVAEDAVQREPLNVAYRVTLGLTCADAGLWTRARGEAERAIAAAPGDAGAQALAARVKQRG